MIRCKLSYSTTFKVSQSFPPTSTSLGRRKDSCSLIIRVTWPNWKAERRYSTILDVIQFEGLCLKRVRLWWVTIYVQADQQQWEKWRKTNLRWFCCVLYIFYFSCILKKESNCYSNSFWIANWAFFESKAVSIQDHQARGVYTGGHGG